jgi:hypothetical protein
MSQPLIKEHVAKFRELSGRMRKPEPERSEALKELGAAEQEIIARIVSQLQPSTRATYEIFAGEPGGVSRWELRKSFGVEPVVRKK